MIPLAVNPIVVVLVDQDGRPLLSATNVAPDLKIVVTQNEAEFRELAKGKTFHENLQLKFETLG